VKQRDILILLGLGAAYFLMKKSSENAGTSSSDGFSDTPNTAMIGVSDSREAISDAIGAAAEGQRSVTTEGALEDAATASTDIWGKATPDQYAATAASYFGTKEVVDVLSGGQTVRVITPKESVRYSEPSKGGSAGIVQIGGNQWGGGGVLAQRAGSFGVIRAGED